MFEKYAVDTVRDSFGKVLCELAEKDDRIVLISADSNGASKTECFDKRFPDRSINAGIAEQNMVSISVGYALEGFTPFASTRAPFISMRCTEQIRTAVCYDNLPVRFVGTGAGYCSGPAGATHWALEDIAIFSALGNMTVFETGDSVLIRKILEKMGNWNHPSYIRLGRDVEEAVYDDDIEIKLNKANILQDGDDGCFIVSGSTVLPALKASEKIRKDTGAEVAVVDMFCIKPFDKEIVLEYAKTGRIVVAQDHNKIGGLGSMISLFLMESNVSCKYKVLGCPDYFVPVATADYLYHKFEYDVDGLVKNMKCFL